MGPELKKTKAQEKDELIAITKQNVIEKQKKKLLASKKGIHDKTGNAANFSKSTTQGNFKLGEKVTPAFLGIELLKSGWMKAYIDFFYLTHETTPSVIVPSEQLKQEYDQGKREKRRLNCHSERTLLDLKDDLKNAEEEWRKKDVRRCFRTYLKVAVMFEELGDYETASYFHQRCLEVSVEFKYIEGQAYAFKGLGICEEKVLNFFEAMNNLETALEKAVEGMLENLAREFSRDLVRVYQTIAIQY
jgi:tetratricopeptide (TPR) repeat protein